MSVTVPRNLRYLDPSIYDRVVHLLETNAIEDRGVKQKYENLTKLMAIKPDSVKFVEIMSKLEMYLLKKSKYTFVISNLPSTAKLSNGKDARVTYANVKDTLNQFGTVFNLYINHGVAYLEMRNSQETHVILNKMQIGNNIIYTTAV